MIKLDQSYLATYLHEVTLVGQVSEEAALKLYSQIEEKYEVIDGVDIERNGGRFTASDRISSVTSAWKNGSAEWPVHLSVVYSLFPREWTAKVDDALEEALKAPAREKSREESAGKPDRSGGL